MPPYPHPITGRQDKVRTDPDWRGRIERYERSLGYIICGATDRKTGEPCLCIPLEDQHRCEKHTPKQRKPGATKSKYPPNVGYGMNLMQFIICKRCKTKEGCPHHSEEEDAECAIEKHIYESTMQLKDKYTIDGDYLQSSMLEAIAFLLIHRFRAERAISFEGMILEEAVGAYGKGEVITNKRPHPLLKHLMDINKQLNQYSKSMEFSPESIHRRESDRDTIDASNAFSEILKQAQANRVKQDDN